MESMTAETLDIEFYRCYKCNKNIEEDDMIIKRIDVTTDSGYVRKYRFYHEGCNTDELST